MGAALMAVGCQTPECDGIGIHTYGTTLFCCECYDLIINSRDVTRDEATKKVKQFFIEHPIQPYTVDKIARYLKIEHLKVAFVIQELQRKDYIQPHWKLKDLSDVEEILKKPEQECSCTGHFICPKCGGP